MQQGQHTAEAASEPQFGAELQRLVHWIKRLGYFNAYFGLMNISFYVTRTLPELPVLVTGFASLAMYGLVLAKVRYIKGSTNWVEICVVSACGLYLPLFTVLLTMLTLLGLVGAG